MILSLDIPNFFDVSFFKKNLYPVYIAYFIYFGMKKIKYGNISWLSIYFLFVLSYFIVHFQLPILESLGFSASGYFKEFIWANEYSGNKATLIASLGIVSFFLGDSISIKKMKRSQEKKKEKLSKRKKKSNVLITITILTYVLFFITSGSYKSGYYAVGDQMFISDYFYSIFNMVLPAAIIERLYYMSSLDLKGINIKKYIEMVGIPLSLMVFWHILFSLYVGDRGPILMFAFYYFSLYLTRIAKINLVKLLIGAVLIGMLMWVVGQARTKSSGAGFFQRMEYAASSDHKHASRLNMKSGPSAMTLELALSGRCLNHAVANVPSKYDFKNGYYQSKQILGGIPFTGRFLLRFFGENERKYDGSANFITYLIQGDDPKYGDGTSPTADLYLDFGIWGVGIGFFIFGMLFHRFDESLRFDESPNLLIWTLAIVYFGGAIYLGRTSILINIQKVIPIYVIICMSQFFSYKTVLK